MRSFRRGSAGPGPPVVTLAVLTLAVAAGGCRAPSQANIELRRQNADLTRQVNVLTRQLHAERQTVRTLRGETDADGTPAGTPAADPTRLGELVTVHGIRLGRLTGVTTLPYDPDAPDPENRTGLRVYVQPTDDAGDRLKAAGAIDVAAFTLNGQANPLGRWAFDVARSAERWTSGGFLYEYVLDCPWPGGVAPASGTELTLRVAFADTLTGRRFTETRQVRVP